MFKDSYFLQNKFLYLHFYFHRKKKRKKKKKKNSKLKKVGGSFKTQLRPSFATLNSAPGKID